MNNLCIIPARGGSKRIPRKNIKNFKGRPIISYSIELAIKSGLFNEIMVSTDDKEIADISKKYGASIPFYRSQKTSNDISNLSDVILEVLHQYLSRGKSFDNVCCILPTAPLTQLEDLTKTFDLLLKDKFETVFPIVEFSYPIMRALVKSEDNSVSMKWSEFSETRSQDLEPTYHDSGSFYWIKVENFIDKQSFEKLLCGGYVIDEIKMQDIDNDTDWKLAELKFEMLRTL
jgi:pseudaminic acid CMP-transferase